MWCFYLGPRNQDQIFQDAQSEPFGLGDMPIPHFGGAWFSDGPRRRHTQLGDRTIRSRVTEWFSLGDRLVAHEHEDSDLWLGFHCPTSIHITYRLDEISLLSSISFKFFVSTCFHHNPSDADPSCHGHRGVAHPSSGIHGRRPSF